MPKINANFEETPSEFKELHPEGWYEAKLGGVHVYEKDDGKTIVKFTLNTVDGTIDNYVAIGVSNNSFLWRQLKSLGCKDEDYLGHNLDIELNDYIGATCIIKVEHKESQYKGKTFNNANISRMYNADHEALDPVKNEITFLPENSINNNSSNTENTDEEPEELPF